jgi:hypothetical protein
MLSQNLPEKETPDPAIVQERLYFTRFQLGVIFVSPDCGVVGRP